MTKLLTFLFTTIPSLFTAFLAFYGRKYVTAAAALLAFAAMLVAFIAAINSILSALVSSLVVPDWVSNAIGMFIPADFSVVLSAIVSAYIARAAWDYAQAKLSVIVQAN